MLDIKELRREHQLIVVCASGLRGLAEMIKTRDDAREAREAIDGINAMLTDHLTVEDQELYPAMLASGDPDCAALAAECSEEMGGILGAWIDYRSRWTVAGILGDPNRFKAATTGVVGALAMRIERENTELYPAMEALSARGANGRGAAALAC